MSDKEYDEALHQFYNDRLKSHLKSTFRKCKDCKGDKQFIEKPGQLIYSCGKDGTSSKDNKDKKCGTQVTIDLAQYLYYPEMKEDTIKIIDGQLDLNQFNEVFSKQEIKDQRETIKENMKLIKKCKKPFSEQNQLKAKENLLKKTHRERMNMKKEQNLIMNKISSEEDRDKRHSLMKEYLQLNQQIKEDYEELLKSTKSLNNFLIVEEGSVKKH